jgi:uncharacterized protein (TIGR02466 family)
MQKNFDIFPTRIILFEKFISNQQRLDAIKFYENYTNRKTHRLLTGDSYSTHESNSNIIDNLIEKFESWKSFRVELQKQLNVYCDETGFQKCSVTNSWMNSQKQNGSLVFHTHPLSQLSGALYLKKDVDCPNLEFINPNPYLKFTNKEKETMYNWQSITFNAGEMDMILFPSWLEHGFYSNNKDSERLVLSFNTI